MIYYIPEYSGIYKQHVMQEISIEQLIDRCIDFFQEHNYTRNRISVYKSLWKRGIVRFMKEKSQTNYSPSIGEQFILTCHKDGIVRAQEREKIRSIQVLDDMLNTGFIRKRCFTPVQHPLYGEIGIAMEKLILHLQDLRRSAITIKDYQLYLNGFLNHLNKKGIQEVATIRECHVLEFISLYPTNKVNITSALRVLFRFWKEEGVTDNDYEPIFKQLHPRRKEKIPSFYNANEVQMIEDSISRSDRTGKRNYAMMLLATRLGLRASDIAGLQFCDIDWDKNIIVLIMQKTGKRIELPLLAEVGNAIVDYLKNARPDLPGATSVFISTRAPYVMATKSMVCAALSAIICQSGVKTDGKHHGPHSMRHSLASAMLHDGTTLPVISEALGHSKTATTMTYLKIDITSLHKCALDVPLVSKDFYLQKGGVFYV